MNLIESVSGLEDNIYIIFSIFFVDIIVYYNVTSGGGIYIMPAF